MTKPVPVRLLAGLGLALLMLSGCATNPATGEQDLNFMSLADEQRVGAQEHPKILAQFGGEVKNDKLKAYVSRIGEKVAAKSELADQKFTFTVLDSPVVNAFALPGGYVYVTRGMLAIMNSEDELAGVIGHEIGHVTARHGSRRQARGTIAQLGVAVLAVVTNNRDVAQLGSIGAQAFLASYSRDNEYESDQLGVRYLKRTGYNPLGMAQSLSALGRNADFLAKKNGGAGSQYNFFSTHPRTPDRVSRATAKARENGGAVTQPVAAKPYLTAIDGMIYGPSAAQGFVLGNRFSHPVLKFTFTVPKGFRLINTPQAVIAKGPNDAQIVFDLDPDPRAARSFRDPRNYITQRWAAKVPVYDLESINVNGHPAATATTRMRSNGQVRDVRLLAVRFDDGRLYRMMFITRTSDTNRYSRPFRETTYSLKALTDIEASKLKAPRMQVATVRRGNSRKTFTRRMKGISDPRETFDMINNLSPDAPLKIGTQVKYIGY